MKCNNCQKEIPDNIKFCPYCGQPVPSISDNEYMVPGYEYPKNHQYKNLQISNSNTRASYYDANNNAAAKSEDPNKRVKKILLAAVLVLITLVVMLGIGFYKALTSDSYDDSIEYANGITYCTDGIIYVDTDVTDDIEPYALTREDEELVDKCDFVYLSTFNPDSDIIYYIKDMKKKKTEICASLYSIYTKDITDNEEDNATRSKLIADDVCSFYASSGSDNAVLYETISSEIYMYSDNGNDYIISTEGLTSINSIFNYENTHIIMTMRGNSSSSITTGFYFGTQYDIYQYDTSTKKLRLINESVRFPYGDNQRLVYIKETNSDEEGGELYISTITSKDIQTTKIDDAVTNIVSTTLTDDITHITYEKSGAHPEDYTEEVYTYDNGEITDLGEIQFSTKYSEYVTFFDLYEGQDEKNDMTQYYTTGSSEIYESPFNEVTNVSAALRENKLYIEAYDDKNISCVYSCDIEYGKEISNIKMIAYNATISGMFSKKYQFYVAGSKAMNLYISADDDLSLMIYDVPIDTFFTLKATPIINDNSYHFIVKFLDYDVNSNIYDLYVVDENKKLKRVETMVETTAVTGNGVIYTKDGAIYYYGADTKEVKKIADSNYYYEMANKYETSISLDS